MFSNTVARWLFLALNVSYLHVDAALSRRQYPPPSSNPTTYPSLSTGISTVSNSSTASSSPSTSLSSSASTSASLPLSSSVPLVSLTSTSSSISSTSTSSTSISSTSTSSTSASLFTSTDHLISSNPTSSLASSTSTTSSTSLTSAASSTTVSPIPSASASSNTYDPLSSTADNHASGANTSSNGASNTLTTGPSTTPAPVTGTYQPLNSSFPITSGPTAGGNATIGVPYIRFGCTPNLLDPWHDARSCSCQSRLYTYYATQSTGETVTTVCHTSGEESYGYRYSAGCSVTTEPLLKTPWVAPDDCCGYCKIEVSTIRVVYWAPQTAAPNASYATGNFSAPRMQHGPATTVEDGFTFTSPSVYVIYSGAHASASCIAMSQTYHVVGNTHVVTRAYAPDALSTVRCVNSLGVGENHPSVEWEAINYNDLYAPIPLSESLRRIDRCFTNRADNDIWGNWMRFPQISLPQDVSELDPTWSTCSGVGLGAMDPPRALVPAAGWEDSPPPSVPADPPSPQPLTESAPSLPKATPGKTVPDPVPRPTSEPQKGTDPVPQPVAQPNNNPPKDSQDPPPNPQPDSPKPSPIPKEPSKSPAAAAPQPQQPSPNPPVVSPAAEGNSAPGNGAGPQPSTGDNKPAVEQASGDQGKQQPANPDPLKSVSAVLFPNPSPNPDSGKQATDGGSGGQAPSNVQHPTAPDSQEASPSRGAKDGPPSGQTPQGTQNTGNSGSNPPSAASPQDHSNSGSNPPAANPPDQSNSVSNPPSAASPQDQSQSTNDQTNPNVNTPSESGSHSAPANNGESQAEVSGTSGGSNPGQTTGKSGSNGSSNVGSPQAGSDLQGNNAGTNPKDGPTTFAFVSNVPPPVAGDHTVGRAPGGAAVVGTATIPQGEAQVLHGTPVSVGPSAIVVGPETFAFSPPQEAGTPAAAPVVSQAPGGGLVVGSKTILPGQKDSVNGHDVSVGSSNVVIDGNSIAFPTVTPPPSTEPVNIAGVQIAHASGNAFVIGGSTYKAGAQVTVSGHTVSVGSGEVAVDGTSHSFPSAPAFSPLLVDGQTMQKASDGHVIIGTATLSPGSRTTMAGQVISVGADNNVVVGSSSYTLPETAGVVKVPTSPDAAPTAPLMVGSQTVSKDANGHIIVGSSTISAGSEVTMDGHIISAASDKVIVDHSTYDLPATAGAVKIPAAAATPITLPNGAVLTPGATAITVSGEVISVFSNDKGFVIDGSTVTLPTVVTPLVAAQSVFTVAGEVFTAAPSGFSIGGTTVSAGGPAVTISGTVVSLGTAGDLRIGSKTIELPTSTAGTQPVLGDVIMSAFNDQGGGGSAATTGGSPGGAGMPTPTPTPTGSGANSQSGSSRNAKNVPGLLLVLAAIFMGFLVL